jgi:prephenate dehydratase
MQFGGMSGLGVNESKQEGQSDKLELWQMDDRMAVLLTLEDKPGILNKALSILTQNGINMTAIQSRP